MTASRPIAAVVLAGGEGLRMGGSKPLRPLGATTLIAHALGLAQGYAETVAVAVRSPDQVAGVPAQLLLDEAALPGPIAGLASALAFAREQGAGHVLTLPCDMPELPADLASRLAGALSASPEARVAVAASAGRLHPVCAVWSVEVASALAAYAAAGHASLKGLAAEVGMTIVDWPIEDADPFANANTPEELAALQSTYCRVGAS